MVRVDDSHGYHGWNWIRGRFLSMDKGTARGLIGAQVFNVELRGRAGSEIAEFSPAGLDLAQVKQACDLTPKKPGRDSIWRPMYRNFAGPSEPAAKIEGLESTIGPSPMTCRQSMRRVG